MKLFVAAHISPIHGPVQALEKYLNEKGISAKFIKHNLFSNSPITYFTDFAGNIFEALKILKKGEKIDLYIGIDNLNALSGVVLKKLNKVEKLVYYVIDYTPRRFANPLLNSIYQTIEKIAASKADFVWNISQRIKEVHIKQGLSDIKNLVVPVGIFPKKFLAVNEADINKNRIVILSQLDKNKGIQLAIETMAQLCQKRPEVELHIIGSGPYEKELVQLTKNLKLESNVKFLGLMQPQEFIPYISRCGLALAPYLDNPDSITYFCDPTKVKEYLAAGLPVITTNVPWIAEEIQNKPMGIMINYEKEELEKAIIKMMDDDSFRSLCRNNALQYMSNYSWEEVFGKAFSETKIAYEI